MKYPHTGYILNYKALDRGYEKQHTLFKNTPTNISSCTKEGTKGRDVVFIKHLVFICEVSTEIFSLAYIQPLKYPQFKEQKSDATKGKVTGPNPTSNKGKNLSQGFIWFSNIRAPTMPHFPAVFRTGKQQTKLAFLFVI